MDRKILNGAVIGLGIGEQHALAILNCKHSKLQQICDIDDQRSDYFKKKYDLPNLNIRTFNEIVEDPSIDFISIASYDDAHFHQVKRGLDHGKHIFVEKPLCQTQAQLEELYKRAREKGKNLTSNLVLRMAPLYVWLKKSIEIGKFGKIYSFDGDYLYGRLHKITQGWRATVKDYSIMEGGGIHIIDLMMFLLNQKPVLVQSLANKIASYGTKFQYRDFQAATFYFQNDIVGRVTANFGCMHPHQHVIRIFGTKGTFIYDDMGPRVYWHRDECKEVNIIQLDAKPGQKGILIPEFIQSTLSGNYWESVQREFDLMSVVLATDKSLVCDQPVRIEYLQ